MTSECFKATPARLPRSGPMRGCRAWEPGWGPRRSGRASLIVVGQDLVEHELQVVGQRRLELHLTSVAGMMKHEAAGVQEGPLEREHRPQIAGHAPAEAAVPGVAD